MIGVVVATWPKNDPVLIVCSLIFVALFVALLILAGRKP